MGRLANQAIFLTIEKIAHLGGGLVLMVVIARVLGERALGDYAFVIAATAVFVPVLDAGLSSRAIKHVAQANDWQTVSEAIFFRLRYGIWALVLMVGIAWWAGKSWDLIIAVILVGISTLAMSVGDAANAGFKGWLKAQYSAVALFITNVGLVGISVWAMMNGWGVVGVALAYMVCRIGYCAGMLGVLIRKVAGIELWHCKISWREKLLQSIGFLPAAFFLGSLLHLNFLTGDWLSGGRDSGFLAIGYRMASALFVLGGASLEGVLAVVAKPEGMNRSLGRSGGMLLAIGFLGGFGVQYTAEPIVLWIFGADFYPAMQGILILAWSLPPFLLCGFLHTVLLARGHERLAFTLMCVLVVVGIILGAVGFAIQGVSGTALAPTITGWIFVGIMGWRVFKRG